MDLIRSILLEVEKSDSSQGCQVKIPGHSPEQLYAHAKLAQDANLLEARFSPDLTHFHVLRLTFTGHEFLDDARSDTLWTKAKDIVYKNTGTLTVEAMKIALQMLIRQALTGLTDKSS